MTKPILFFIEGSVPTNEEFEQASEYMNKGPFLEFVSLIDVDLNGPKKEYSAVYGKVPETYKEQKSTEVYSEKKIGDNVEYVPSSSAKRK